MSMGFMVYLVDEAEVKAIPGSGDLDLLKWLLEPPDQLDELDEESDFEIEERCPGFSHADAIRDIVAGRVTRPEAGFVYANAFDSVCSVLGDWVQNCFHRCHPKTVTQLDELFRSHGVGLRFYDDLVRRVPVPLPDPGDIGVTLGHWTEAEVLAAAPAFRAMRAAGPHGEPFFEVLLDEVGEWIALVEAKPGSMLVARYS